MPAKKKKKFYNNRLVNSLTSHTLHKERKGLVMLQLTSCLHVASLPGHSQILSCSCGEKSGELHYLVTCCIGRILCGHVAIIRKRSPPFLVCDIVLLPRLLLIFLHSCEIKSKSAWGQGYIVSMNDVL